MTSVRIPALRLSALLMTVATLVGAISLLRPTEPAAAQRDPACIGVITGTVRLAAMPGASVRPIAGAHVTLSAAALGARWTSVAVDTAADGTYRHENVCDGAYTVRAELPTAQGSLSGSYDANHDGVPDVLTLAPAQRVFGTIDIALASSPLNPGRPNPTTTALPCAFSDGAIAGTVFGPDGQPFAGAYVSLRSANATSSNAGIGKSAVSGADGGYRVADLCGGGYQVSGYARANPGVPGPLTGSYDADGDGRPDTVLLVEAARSAGGIDIHLRLAPTAVPAEPTVARPGRPEPTAVPPIGPQIGARCAGTIAGTVTDRDGHAVAGARVLALGQTATNPTSANTPITVVALSLPDGRYRLAPLCSGTYDIVALTVAPAGVDTGLHDPERDRKPNPVDLNSRQPEVTGVDIVMPGLANLPLRPRLVLPIEPVPGR